MRICLTGVVVASIWAAGVPTDMRPSRPVPDEWVSWWVDDGQTSVRPPAAAGQFYPDNPAGLRAAIDAYLLTAKPPAADRPIALVAPHAGYVFSGQIAADAYRQAQPFEYDTVVILGPNHTEPAFDGIGLFSGHGFRTPLGVATIDADLARALVELDPDVTWHDGVHAREHGIEVQVPFVQRLFPAAAILPIVVATTDLDRCARLGQALARVLEGRRALLVASSDLSHYPSAADARRVDLATLDVIGSRDPAAVKRVMEGARRQGVPNLHTAACGEAPILAVLSAARAMGATRARLVSYANSADSPAGDPTRVVGYGAVVLDDGGATDGRIIDGDRAADSSGALSDLDRRALVAYARDAIDRFVTTGTAPLARDVPAALLRRQGAFVSIKKHGKLRGCIGRIVPDGPLYWLVGAVALQAASADPRFGPLRPGELKDVAVEVALLTPPRQLAAPSDIVIGRDGVVLVKEGKSAVFLPEVAVEQRWTREELLAQLGLKAGLESDAWRSGALLYTFQTEVIRERREE